MGLNIHAMHPLPNTRDVKARTPVVGYAGLCAVIAWIWLQTSTRVIIGVDV